MSNIRIQDIENLIETSQAAILTIPIIDTLNNQAYDIYSNLSEKINGQEWKIAGILAITRDAALVQWIGWKWPSWILLSEIDRCKSVWITFYQATDVKMMEVWFRGEKRVKRF